MSMSNSTCLLGLVFDPPEARSDIVTSYTGIGRTCAEYVLETNIEGRIGVRSESISVLAYNVLGPRIVVPYCIFDLTWVISLVLFVS